MKSFTTLKNLFTTLSLNSSSSNDTLAGILINDIHRQLLLKFFDNERTVTMLTIGPQTLTANVLSGTTAVLTGGTSATLSSAWSTSNISCQQLVVFSDGEQRTVNFVQGSPTITWQSPLSASVGTSVSCVGVQSYPLPANVSKVKNATITIGQLVYTPAPVQSIQEWTKLNALPYISSIPAYFYIYNNQINFFPIPSASNEVMTLNCQIALADMTYADYTTPGTIASGGMTVGSNIVTGSSTTWTSFPQGVDLTFANIFLTANPPQGDGLPYQVQSFSSGTSATLVKPVVNVPTGAGGGTVLIGQYPLLHPDFHDTIVYGALRVYFNSIVKDPEKYSMYNKLYNERLELMKFYLGNKQVNVDLSVSPALVNPNLFINGT